MKKRLTGITPNDSHFPAEPSLVMWVRHLQELVAPGMFSVANNNSNGNNNNNNTLKNLYNES